ncbi:MAG: tRNA (N6-isopentenyl adenosine(37)-C2)-methylthiotransferase MiaB [Thermoanaerobaculia bacterium]|jgi:tRNA-2-methylthio-N6-dimethylallyladenosine synthase|nr:tRNA (N6-isopentenyl adenosine(37)-C2)-methylthiotransferase MiaB [Thermoanaerobaculia bacterium]
MAPVNDGRPTAPRDAETAARPRRVFVETWGCQMNELDSRRFVGLMSREGWLESNSADDADLVLLNTCSVRDKAEQKVYDYLGRVALLKKSRPGLRLGVCGCVAQQEGEEILRRSPAVDFVLGTGRIELLPAVVRRVEREGDRPVEVGFDLDEVAYTPGVVARTIAHRASITVIEGCNKHCTFCVVPTTRGRERSRRFSEVVEECRRLVGEGVVEIELLGQTVNAYSDPESGAGLAELLRAISSIAGLRRLRFVTSHPRNFGDDLIAAMAECEPVCPSLHLPFQSGSDSVLRRMKRQYTRAEYVDLAGRLRSAVPGLSLSTDIIVGFPGESEEDFASTIRLLDEVRFGAVFCFVYSPRPSTAAARWDADVPARVAQERLARLNDHQQQLQLQANEAMVGQVLEVLVEGPDRTGKRVSGRSPFNHLVHIENAPGTPAGSFVQTRIEQGLANSLLGRALRIERAEPDGPSLPA